MTLRRRVHMALDSNIASDLWTATMHRLLVVLVLASVTAVVLESVPEIAAQYGFWFTIAEDVALAVFTLEYGLRLWTAPEHTPFSEMHPWMARWNFAISGSAIIDLMSILPFFLTFFVPADLKILLIFRLLRFFKLARYSAGMRSLAAALEAERKALLASATVLFGLVLVAASAIHLVEHQAQPDKFGSIPDSMWWAIVTLTTVGYGDVVPVTVAGRIVAGFTMLMGNAFAAFPVLTGGIALPILVGHFGANPAAVASLGMLSVFCGTLMTPLAANFNLVPSALLEIPDRYAVIKAQIPTALLMLATNMVLMYVLAFPR